MAPSARCLEARLWVSAASNCPLIPGIAQSKNRQHTVRRLVGHGHREHCNWSIGPSHPWLPFASTTSTVDITTLPLYLPFCLSLARTHALDPFFSSPPFTHATLAISWNLGPLFSRPTTTIELASNRWTGYHGWFSDDGWRFRGSTPSSWIWEAGGGSRTNSFFINRILAGTRRWDHLVPKNYPLKNHVIISARISNETTALILPFWRKSRTRRSLFSAEKKRSWEEIAEANREGTTMRWSGSREADDRKRVNERKSRVTAGRERESVVGKRKVNQQEEEEGLDREWGEENLLSFRLLCFVRVKRWRHRHWRALSSRREPGCDFTPVNKPLGEKNEGHPRWSSKKKVPRSKCTLKRLGFEEFYRVGIFEWLFFRRSFEKSNGD